MALDEIATIVGPGKSCGRDRPLVLADTTGDGIPEVVLGCDQPDAQTWAAKTLYVLDGGATLASRISELSARIWRRTPAKSDPESICAPEQQDASAPLDRSLAPQTGLQRRTAAYAPRLALCGSLRV